jgi:aspartyl-tRNA(Asn)/glutamyl-tRNA(Gln) amidotransferase subunit A
VFPSVIDLAGAVRVGSTTAADVLEQHLARVDAREGEIHAFNLVTAETARRDNH